MAKSQIGSWHEYGHEQDNNRPNTEKKQNRTKEYSEVNKATERRKCPLARVE